MPELICCDLKHAIEACKTKGRIPLMVLCSGTDRNPNDLLVFNLIPGIATPFDYRFLLSTLCRSSMLVYDDAIQRFGHR